MNERLKTSQLRTLIMSFIMGSTLLITMIDGIAGQSTWMILIAGFAVSLPFLLIFSHLSKRFPGKSLVQMNDIIFGKVIGRIISLGFITYFFLLLTFNIHDAAGFYTGYIMPDTPPMVFMVVIVLACAFAVHRGITAVARVSVLIVIFTVCTVVLTVLMLISQMDFTNFLPMLDKPLLPYLQATQITAELPILEVVAMLMVTPLVRDNRKLTGSWVSGAAAAVLVFLTIAVRNTAVLGSASQVLGDNSFEAVRLISIGEFFTRIELIIALNYTASLFIKICALYYVTVNGIAQLLGLERSSSLILPLGSIALVFAAVKVESVMVHTVWGAQYAPVFSFPCTVFLPLLMVVVAAIRKRRTPPPAEWAQPLPEAQPKKKAGKQASASGSVN